MENMAEWSHGPQNAELRRKEGKIGEQTLDAGRE